MKRGKSIGLASPILMVPLAVLALSVCNAVEETKAEKLYFVSMASDNAARQATISIYTMNADGMGRVKLTKSDATELDPALSPDGKRIVYTLLDEKAMRADLHVMNADGTQDKPLTKVEDKQIAFGPGWSPDGKRVAYAVMKTPEGGAPENGAIHVIDADGQNAKKIGEGIIPSWSPDGKRVLYTVLEKAQDFNPRLHVMDADGKNDKELLKGRGMLGAYSPDGKRIVYMGAKEGNDALPHIYVCNADGSEPTLLTKDEAAFELAPRWSADGKRIYFNRMLREQGPDKVGIYVMDADGKNEKRLSKEGASDILGGSPLFLLTRTRSRQQ
jgi:Tol biopolymer transport system component